MILSQPVHGKIKAALPQPVKESAYRKESARRFPKSNFVTELCPVFCYYLVINQPDMEAAMMKRILFPLLALFLTAALCSAQEAGDNAYRQITMDEAIAMMESETGYVILDVRTIAEYESGHIPGAVCVPNETIGTAEIPELPDKDQLILVYCRSGNRSKQASAKLAALGYTNIVEFGGINAWPGEVVAGLEPVPAETDTDL